MVVSWNGGTPKSSILLGFSRSQKPSSVFVVPPWLWKPPYIPIISYAVIVIFNNIHWSWNIHSHCRSQWIPPIYDPPSSSHQFPSRTESTWSPRTTPTRSIWRPWKMWRAPWPTTSASARHGWGAGDAKGENEGRQGTKRKVLVEEIFGGFWYLFGEVHPFLRGMIGNTHGNRNLILVSPKFWFGRVQGPMFRQTNSP